MERGNNLDSNHRYTAALKALGLLHNKNDDNNNNGSGNKTLSRKAAERVVGIPEIQRAYRRLARIHHPDRGGDEGRFVCLTAAKDFLVHGGATSTTTTTTTSSENNTNGFGPFSWKDCDGDNGSRAGETTTATGTSSFSSRVLVRGRSCVRDLVVSVYRRCCTDSILVLVATDDALKIVVQRIADDGATPTTAEKRSQQQKQAITTEWELESSSSDEESSPSILCCALSVCGRFAFAGNTKGQVRRYSLQPPHDDALFSAADDANDDETDDPQRPLDRLVGCALLRRRRKKGFMGGTTATTKDNIVSLDVISDRCCSSSRKEEDSDATEKKTRPQQHIVIAACDSSSSSPSSLIAVAMFRFKSRSVETLWRVATPSCNLLDNIRTIDALVLSAVPAITSGEGRQQKWSVWLGGSNRSNEATLVNWEVVACPNNETTTTEDGSSIDSEEDEDWWWSDSSDDSSGNDAGSKKMLPSIASAKTFQPGGFGSVYSMDRCPASGLLAATVGSDVVLLDTTTTTKDDDNREGSTDDGDGSSSSWQRKTTRLTTDHVLYCVRILSSPSEQRVAACGAGESVLVWSLATRTIQHHIRLDSIRHCNLSTNCVMALDWLLVEEGGGAATTSIVSGGYDGNVTRWFLDNNNNEDPSLLCGG